MKIIICVLMIILGISTIGISQPGEGRQRAGKIEEQLNRIFIQKECANIDQNIKRRLIILIKSKGAEHPNDANKVSEEFEADMKKMVAKGQLPRLCYQQILGILNELNLTAAPQEEKPAHSQPIAIGQPSRAEVGSLNKADSAQLIKPPTGPITQDKRPNRPTKEEPQKPADLNSPKQPETKPDSLKPRIGPITQDKKSEAPRPPISGHANPQSPLIPKNSTPAKPEPPHRPVTGPLKYTKSVTGTGQTTGIIANLTIENTSDNPLILEIPDMFIPSIDNLQPYIIPATKPVVIPPKTEMTIPMIGYCVDISKPPVPSGENMPPISTWIVKDPDLYDQNGIIPEKLFEYWGIPNPNSGITNSDDFPIKIIQVDPESPQTGPFVTNHLSRTPNSQDRDHDDDLPPNYFNTVVIPRENIDHGAPLIFDALDKITKTTDNLIQNGDIRTPFSTNPEKEREAVIQQVIWIYTSALVGDPYIKEQFQDKMIEQYESSTGQDIKSAPIQLRDRMDQGVDDFWNTFTLVGVEAKILSDKPIQLTPIPHLEKLEDAFGKHNPDHVKPHTDTTKEALENVGAEAHAKGDKVHIGPSTEPNKDLIQSEPAHILTDKQPVSIARMTPEDLARFEDKLVLDPQKPNKEKCPPPNIKITVVSLKGNEIIIQLPDGSDLDAELITAGTEIPENSQISTGDNTELVVKSMICRDGKFVDHTGVKVQELTEATFDQLYFSYPNVVQRVKIKEGEIRIKVTDERREYETDIKVATPNATSGVSGTEFIARVNSNIEEILVIEGCVDVLKTDATTSQKVCSGDKFIIK